MQLQTIVHIDKMPFVLTHKDRPVCMGSCFAEEARKRMMRDGFAANDGGFGTLYNPASIAIALRRLIEGNAMTREELKEQDGLYHSMLHHGAYSRSSAEETMRVCNEALAQSRKALHEAGVLILTFGTAWIYEQDGQAVSNCHKMPADCFSRRRMTVEEIVNLYNNLLSHPDLREKRIIFTVSPIRHKKDGLHENQLSKAILLLAADQLVKTAPTQRCYFPAFEIMMDELRDYRFYADDMLHPTAQAADYVYERFAETFFDTSTQERARIASKFNQEREHRPLHLSESEKEARYEMQEKKRQEIRKNYPEIEI